MADVSFDIKTVGIPKVKSDLSSIFDLQKKQSLAVEQIHERSALRIKQIEERLAKDIANIQSKGGKDKFEILAKEVAAEERAAAQIKRIRENLSLAEKQIQDREAQNSQLNYRAIGLAAQAAGFGNVGYGIRSIGAITNAGIGIGGLAAIAGIGVAASAVIVAFNAVSDVVRETAGAFLGAISEIGGARSLQQMIVETAKNEQITNQARFTVGADQRVSKTALNDWAAALASNASLGGQSKEEWLKAAGLFGTETGLQKDLINNSDLTNTLGMMMHLGGINPTQILGAYAAIYNQNRNLPQEQILNVLRSGIGIGREGQFNIQDLATGGGRLTSVPGSRLGGDYLSNMRSVLSYGALVKGKTPGRSLEEAGTEVDAFFRELAAPAHVAAAKQLGVKFDTKTGNITNPDEALAKVVANKALAEQLIPGLATRESGMFLGHVATGIPGVDDKSTPKQIEEALLAQLHHYESLSITQEQLTKENQDAIGITDQLQAKFNEISDTLEVKFGPILTDTVVPAVQLFADTIIEHKDEIGNVFKDIVNGGIKLATYLPDVLTAFSALVEGVLSMAHGLAGSTEENLNTAHNEVIRTQSHLAMFRKTQRPGDEVEEETARMLEGRVSDAVRREKLWQSIFNIENKSTSSTLTEPKDMTIMEQTQRIDEIMNKVPDKIADAINKTIAQNLADAIEHTDKRNSSW